MGYDKKKMPTLQESFLVRNGLIMKSPNWFAQVTCVSNQIVSELFRYNAIDLASLKASWMSSINIV